MAETKKNEEKESVNDKVQETKGPSELDIVNASLKDLQEKLAALMAENEDLKKAKAEAPKVPVQNPGNMVLICNAKVRTFTVSPEKVLKIYRGTKEGQILRDRVLTITPGSVLEVTPELAEFLLSYKKDFSRYDVPLS